MVQSSAGGIGTDKFGLFRIVGSSDSLAGGSLVGELPNDWDV